MNSISFNDIQIGTRVKLKTKEDLMAEGCEYDCDGDMWLYHSGSYVTKPMFQFLGKELIVTYKEMLSDGSYFVELNDDEQWNWFNDTIKCVVNKSKPINNLNFQAGDKVKLKTLDQLLEEGAGTDSEYDLCSLCNYGIDDVISSPMENLLGEVVTVYSVVNYNDEGIKTVFYIEEDGTRWTWYPVLVSSIIE